MDGKICVCIYECMIFDTDTKEVVDKFNVSGTAKLAEGDTMSDLGVKLADSRAKLTAYKKAATIISDAQYAEYDALVETMCDLMNFSDFMHHMKRKEINHIKFLEREA